MSLETEELETLKQVSHRLGPGELHCRGEIPRFFALISTSYKPLKDTLTETLNLVVMGKDGLHIRKQSFTIALFDLFCLSKFQWKKQTFRFCIECLFRIMKHSTDIQIEKIKPEVSEKWKLEYRQKVNTESTS